MCKKGINKEELKELSKRSWSHPTFVTQKEFDELLTRVEQLEKSSGSSNNGDPNCEHINRSEWIIAANGVNTRTCLDCGWVEIVDHVCSLKETDVYIKTATGEYDPEYCYETITTCEIEGCDYETRFKIPHDFQVESNIFGSIYTCYNCGYSYEVENPM